ncbi:Mov34/MPN/PAD-1 family deubiquitinase [Emydomyces testavorans]|uniref:Mov34/MPN/PAD-1 family deubiquitinase n=1 Tax=Emydomyces testavorans TaxID=2070801 RepID=A0AAF0DM44_9EURO|nr:Mov34/MPN/PAD-1 family deubiquitinase [Emydomyces testavorans]
MIPPLSVADLARQAAEYDYNPDVKLRYWLRSASSLLKEAAIYEREGNDQQAYLLLFRHAQLVLVNLIHHPEAREPSNRRALAVLQREVQRSLEKLEVLKPRINKRYEQYLQNRRERESWQTNASQPETRDPAIAGRPHPLAAAENRDLAVKLAQTELRRRATAKLGQYLNEGYLSQTQRKPVITLGQDQSAQEYGKTDADDLARRLQEVRARFEQSQRSDRRDARSSQSTLDGQALPRQPELDHSTSYRYPAVPGQSTFSTISETSPPVPGKVLLEPFQLQPPALPAKIPERPPKSISLPAPAAPPVPSKILSSTPTTPSSPEPTRQAHNASPAPSSLHPSTFTFKPSSYLENGSPLRTIFISPSLRTQFLQIARPNTLRNLETCGILCGSLISNAFFISKLLIPDQESTPDTCEMVNEAAVFEHCDAEDLMVLGWIHTHPSQTCFMSSRDLHTQSGFQVMLAESIAIVCAPSKMPDWGVFRLTDPPGLKTVLACTQKGLFHPHGEMDIYTDALRPGHVFEAKGLEFETVDLRKN